MNIAVCIKQVPTLSRIEFDYEKKTILRDGVPLEMNVFDLIALGRAIELKEEVGGEVTAITMGPPQAKEVLAHALAVGADHGVIISDRVMAGSDTLATSRTLALALKDRGFDLIMCGRNSTDAETGQVGPELAEILGIPHVSRARKLEYRAESNSVVVERETDEGHEVLEMSLPALVTATEGLSEERYARRRLLMEARKRPVEEIGASQLSDDSSIFGAVGSPTWVADIRLLEPQRLGVVIEDSDPKSAAQSVVERLRNRPDVVEEDTPSQSQWQRYPLGQGETLWVVAERSSEGLRRATLENLGKARMLAKELRGQVFAVLVEDFTAEEIVSLHRYGADFILDLHHPVLRHPTSPLTASIMARALEDYDPYAVLFSSTANGRDLASRVAARLSLGLTGDCIDLELDEERRLVQLKPALGGNVVAPILSKVKPYLVTLRPGLLTPVTPEDDPAVTLESPPYCVEGPDPLRLLDSRVEEDAGGLELERAEVVIGVGMGIGGPESLPKIRELAERLDASIAATRSVTDAGWLPKQLQVGLTGRAIAPRLYIAVGIRGDFNHVVGIQKAGTVVGINTTRRHPIFQAADFGILGSWEEYLPALVEALAREG